MHLYKTHRKRTRVRNAVRLSFLGFLLLASIVCSHSASADVIYQTATMGSPGADSGNVLGVNSYIGARFQTSQPVVANTIGGHFGSHTSAGQQIFGALIRLDSLSDFPNSIHPLNTSDVLAVALLTLPFDSDDITAPIGPVVLTPGTYAILYGSGQFGATGNATVPNDNIPNGSVSEFNYLSSNGEQYLNTGFYQIRLEVSGIVPEPGGFAICASACILYKRPRRTGNKRQQYVQPKCSIASRV